MPLRNRVAPSENGRDFSPVPKTDAETLKEEISARYDALNALWKQAEDQLRQFLVPTSVVVPTDAYVEPDEPPDWGEETRESIGWVKLNGAWRICLGTAIPQTNWATTWKPITECTFDIRKEYVEHFPKLREAVELKARETVPELDEAIAKLSATLG